MAELLQWSNAALADISECVNNAYLKSKNKNNLRQLTKAEFKSVEKLKVEVFANTNAFDEIDDNYIYDKLTSETSVLQALQKL